MIIYILKTLFKEESFCDVGFINAKAKKELNYLHEKIWTVYGLHRPKGVTHGSIMDDQVHARRGILVIKYMCWLQEDELGSPPMR